MQLSPLAFYRFAVDHIGEVEELGDAAHAIFTVEGIDPKWQAFKPAGDILAPMADQLIALASARDLDGDTSIPEAEVLALLAERPAARTFFAQPRDRAWLANALKAAQFLLPLLMQLAAAK